MRLVRSLHLPPLLVLLALGPSGCSDQAGNFNTTPPPGSDGEGSLNAECVPGDGTDSACPGMDCETILDAGFSTGDGSYWIAPLGSGAPYEVACLMDSVYDGGGWTLTAVSSDDGQDTWTWNNRAYWDTDMTTFGSLVARNEDFKSPAHHEVSASDLLFVHAPSGEWAAYNGANPSDDALSDFLGRVAQETCYANGVGGIPMSEGSITASGSLCSTSLYINGADHDGIQGCGVDSAPDHAHGPHWSAGGNDGCPLDDPGESGGFGPVASFPTTEWGAVGFGRALSLNTGAPRAAQNYIQVYVRSPTL